MRISATLAVAAVLCVTGGSALNITALFHEFTHRHARPYSFGSEEWAHRLRIFTENVLEAHMKNSEQDTAVYGVNKFSDLTKEEFAVRYLGTLNHQHDLSTKERRGTEGGPLVTPCTSSPVSCTSIAGTEARPGSFDWRKEGVITGVYNQGECGGCWAFSAVETLESAWLIAKNKPVDGGHFSVQQVISCATNNYQCVGGWIWNALEFVWQLSVTGSGIGAENEFQFTCKEGCRDGAPSCPASSAFAGDLGKINSTCHCDTWAENKMEVFVSKYGPLAIKVDADPWRDYTGGIVRYHCSSYQDSGDHAVQIVGYSVDNTHNPPLPYWIIRNSWGEDWGENGYIRVYRGENVCGVTNDVNFAFSSPPAS